MRRLLSIQGRRPALGFIVTALGCIAVASGCSTAHYTVNEPLTETRSRPGYSIGNLAASNNSDSMIVMLALSGGGYRAAALALAVMEVLRDTPIEWDGHQRSLLDEVDFISAVSGGSLTAAYYALHRETFFDTFESKVLAFDLQSALTTRVLSPSGLWRQTSARFGRSDLLQEVLGEHVFSSARFEDLPRLRPMVFINATDISNGERFDFSQDQFDRLCSNLDRLPLARAVAASMAVPLVFSPITLWNHGERCRAPALARPHGDSTSGRFMHLADGGLADNTGVSAPLEIIAARGGLVPSAVAAGFKGVRKRVFIVVNAQVNPSYVDDDSPDTPGLLRQLRSFVDVPIDRHSQASVHVLKNATRQWARELQSLSDDELRGAIQRDTSFHVVEITIMKAANGPEKDRLKQIPTVLRSTPEDLVALRSFVRQTLNTDPQWQNLLRELQPSAPISASITGARSD